MTHKFKAGDVVFIMRQNIGPVFGEITACFSPAVTNWPRGYNVDIGSPGKGNIIYCDETELRSANT